MMRSRRVDEGRGDGAAGAVPSACFDAAVGNAFVPTISVGSNFEIVLYLGGDDTDSAHA